MRLPTVLQLLRSGAPAASPANGDSHDGHHRRSRLRRAFMVSALAIGGMGVGGVGTVLLAQPAAAAPTLIVSPSGADSGNCQSANCATLGYALSQAVSGDIIVLEPGTYEVSADPTGTSNTVPASLSGITIESDATNSGNASNTIVDGTAAINGLVVNANNVTVSGITFQNTGAAGIFVSPPSSAATPAAVSGETIENDVVNNADQCELTPSTSACNAAIGAGDYGESIWLMSVSASTLEGTTIENGLGGGLLVSDEMGPNFGNTIENNQVINNKDGCGITLAGHNTAAVYASGPNAGQSDPTAGGVYNNTVENNVSNGNGATGVGLFNFAYSNTIEGNTFNGNGEPGVVMNPTFSVGDVNGNSVMGNTVGVNSVSDGPGEDSAGEHNVFATQTIGIIIVAPAGNPVTGTLIENNTVSGDFYGIFLMPLASSTTLSGNTISVAKGGKSVFNEPAPGAGYWQVGSDGGAFTFGQAPFEGSAGNLKLAQPVVGLASTPDGGGYWLAAKDGGLFAYGDANYYGSLPGAKVSVSNIVGIASSPDGGGYWMVGADGGIFNFGDAGYFGSLPGSHVKVSNIVGIVPTPDGKGYWLVGSDGGIFNFGDAKYYGSVPGEKVSVSNVVGIAASPDGKGYSLAGADGGMFIFGDAGYFGSLPGQHIKVSNIVGLMSTP